VPRLSSAAGKKGAKPICAVFLVGFMGCGKTSVGRALAKRLNWVFEDLDLRIEEQEGCTIAEIFEHSGEPAFRQIENRALFQLLKMLPDRSGMVVALGGGAFAHEMNRNRLKRSNLLTIFLDAPVKVLWERCSKQMKEIGMERPLLRSIEGFRRLYQLRQRSYSQAALTVSTAGCTVEEIANRIHRSLVRKKIVTEGEVE
jgi:shikimate kinase